MKPRNIIALLIVLAAGEIAGSICSVLHPQQELWYLAFVQHGIGVLSKSFRAMLTPVLLYSLLWLMLFAILGLTVCAAPSALLLLFLHGMTIGAVLAGYYSGHILTGLLKTLLFVTPYAAAQTGLLLLAARESLRSSRLLKRMLSCGTEPNGSFRDYVLRYLVLAAGLLLTGMAQAFWGGSVCPLVLHWLVRR